MLLREEIAKKWAPVLEHKEMPEIKDKLRRDTTARILENTLEAMKTGSIHKQESLLESNEAPANVTGSGISNYDPVLITLLRRAMPNLVAYDICGVQAMTGPTGIIFSMRSRYTNQSGAENFYNEVNTGFTTVAGASNSAVGYGMVGANVSGNAQLYNTGAGMSTAQMEMLGSTGNIGFAEMAFTIDKTSVTAGGRALKAEYSIEMAQDLKAIHGLDAEAELSNMITIELLAEINREIVRTVNVTATTGCSAGTTTAGTFDLDTDSSGRWSVEKFKGLMFQLERECNAIARTTRRGKGNLIICSSDVASALQMAGVLDYTPAIASNNLQVDDTGATFAGVLNGRIKVFIDPYAGLNYITAGFKGSHPWNAGLFYCPYTPLQMVKGVGSDNLQPVIGFKTRYGVVSNPFSPGASAGDGTLVPNTNLYYRRFFVNNLL